MGKRLSRWVLSLLGAGDIYEEVVVQDREKNINAEIRKDLQHLLKSVNAKNTFFIGKFDDFLAANESVDDETFFREYAKLPAFSKQEYAEAGVSVMPKELGEKVDELELKFEGKPLDTLSTLRKGDFIMPMATGGSTSLPLKVHMTKYHMFSMLFTFFKCWYRMGWRPGEKILVFYPKNTYNIDDLAKFNKIGWLTGFKIHLFDRIDKDSIAGLVDELNSFKPKMLLVFPSPLNMIAETIRKYKLPLKHHPELINTSGETFFDCQRKNIADVFTRSKVEDSYGSVELGEIAHETTNGLEVFSNVSYIETAPNENGKPEMIVTSLKMTEFPFIRYKMKDIADIEFRQDANGRESYVLSNIEGKDSNYILSHSGQRFYPSFFNQFVNRLNEKFNNAIAEIKVFERGQKEMEVQYIVRENADRDAIRDATCQLLNEEMGAGMEYQVKFVEFIDHDYRRKYRVIERIGDVEYAGGIVGDTKKLEAIEQGK
jgi:phenylacetate-coenzyme A ligase PaaK-like adenylate-forming protein